MNIMAMYVFRRIKNLLTIRSKLLACFIVTTLLLLTAFSLAFNSLHYTFKLQDKIASFTLPTLNKAHSLLNSLTHHINYIERLSGQSANSELHSHVIKQHEDNIRNQLKSLSLASHDKQNILHIEDLLEQLFQNIAELKPLLKADLQQALSTFTANKKDINDILVDTQESGGFFQNALKIIAISHNVHSMLLDYEDKQKILHQHLASLLESASNAIKYQKVESVPEIHISYRELPTEWKFSIQDNGIGMRQEYCEQIFIPFKRLHRKEDYSGTGIGHRYVKKLLKKTVGVFGLIQILLKGPAFTSQ